MLTWGCRSDPGSRRSACRFGQEHRIADVAAKELDDIRLVADAQGPVALYSEPAGLFARRLDREGRPLQPARRVAGRCRGGLDAVAHAGRVHLACLRPDPSQPTAGELWYAALDGELRPSGEQHMGPVGALSRGVGVAVGKGGARLLWHDASPDAQRVHLATVGAAQSSRVLSSPGRGATWPALLQLEGQLWATWAETWLQDGEPRARLALWQEGGRERGLRQIANEQSMPQLLPGASGPVLAFRDRRRRGDRTGLYLAELAAVEGSSPLKRVARADGVARPGLCACMGGFVAATPRTYAGDYFVGVNFLDQSLNKPGGEQQFYEDAHEFAMAAVTCLGDRALLLVAERARLHGTGASLRSVAHRCHF